MREKLSKLTRKIRLTHSVQKQSLFNAATPLLLCHCLYFGEGVVPYPPREWPFPLRRMHGESTPIERGSAYAEPLLSVENRYV